MLIDKQKAKKGSWRIPEKTLFLLTLLGGGIGTITGMYLFRHKTRKLYFTVRFSSNLVCRGSINSLLAYILLKLSGFFAAFFLASFIINFHN